MNLKEQRLQKNADRDRPLIDFENEAAKKLYLSFCFEEHPEYYKEGAETPAILKL